MLVDFMKRALRALMVVGSVGLVFQFPAAFAQDDDEDPKELDKVEIVGSRIKRTDIEGPEPVIVISADDIENAGFATVQEVLDTLPQNSGGGFDSQFVFGFTPSASAVDIRGFGVGRVLILLDGRRIPVFPLAAGGTQNFVDLNSIPAAAIERIEILTAGASAIYGSDAISGVINVVLRKDVEGTTVNLRTSDTSDGGGAAQRVQLLHGITTNKSTTTLVMEYFDQDEIMAGDREYAANDVVPGAYADPTFGLNGDGSIGAFSIGSPGGTLFDAATGAVLAGPNCSPNPNNLTITPEVLATGGDFVHPDGFCRFNRSRFRQLFPENKRFSLTLNADRVLTPDLTAFARATYQQSEFNTQIEPMFYQSDFVADPLGLGIYDTDPNDPRDGVPNNPNDISNGTFIAPVIFRRMLEFGPRRSETDNVTWSVLAGLQGVIANRFDFEFGAGHYVQDVKRRSFGYGAPESGFDAAVREGRVNLFQPLPQAIVDEFRYEPRTDGESTLTGLDFDITGDLFDTWAGTVGFAAVVEWAREEFQDLRDPQILAGNVISLGGSSGAGERDRWGAGVEFLVPLHDTINVSLAGRFDEYADASLVGNAVSPRVAVEWRPLSTLLVRGHWGESFRAPDLQRLFGAQTRAFQDLVDTQLCEQNGGTKGQVTDPSPADGFNECTTAIISTPLLIGSNTALEEEEGTNYGFGVVWNILDDLAITVDYYNVELEGIVVAPTAQFILDNSNLFPANSIQRDVSAVLPTNPGGLDLVVSAAQNLSIRESDGIDFLLEYNLETNRWGRFDVDFSISHVLDIKQRFSPVSPLQDIAEVPENRANLRVDWLYGDFGLTLFGSHIDSYEPFNTTAFFDHVTSYTRWNLQARYATPFNSIVRLGVNNMFNREPPDDFQDDNAGWPFYNQFIHDVFGRNWFVQYTQNF